MLEGATSDESLRTTDLEDVKTLEIIEITPIFSGAARTFFYIQVWVSEEGHEFEKFSKKGCFLSFEW